MVPTTALHSQPFYDVCPILERPASRGQCDLTCRDYQRYGTYYCTAFTTVPSGKCICASGYVRDDFGTCISQYECTRRGSSGTGSQSCGIHEHYEACGSACPKDCASVIQPIATPCTLNCVQGCVCNAGYVRKSTFDRRCVPRQECYSLGSGEVINNQCTDPYAQWDNCNAYPGCQATCTNPSGSPSCPAVCTSGCVCKPGYIQLSELDRKCVLRSTCNANTPSSQPGLISRAIAVFAGVGLGKPTGNLRFSQARFGHAVTVTGQLSGLNPNQRHGLHVHTRGDLSSGCDSVGDHFNPHGRRHGARQDLERHVGDLGNIQADSQGNAIVNFEDSVIQLTGANSIVGRAIVIHEHEDDLGKGSTVASSTTGNSGARRGCAVIGVEEG